jgi:CRISPR/Cas system-associated exonuclease Cas4 (RecB family)
MLKRKSGSKTITASEISQYVYCPVSWYLKRSGEVPYSAGLKRGLREHEKAGGRLVVLEKREAAAGFFRRLGYLFGLAAVLLLGWLLWTHF